MLFSMYFGTVTEEVERSLPKCRNTGVELCSTEYYSNTTLQYRVVLDWNFVVRCRGVVRSSTGLVHFKYGVVLE